MTKGVEAVVSLCPACLQPLSEGDWPHGPCPAQGPQKLRERGQCLVCKRAVGPDQRQLVAAFRRDLPIGGATAPEVKPPGDSPIVAHAFVEPEPEGPLLVAVGEPCMVCLQPLTEVPPSSRPPVALERCPECNGVLHGEVRATAHRRAKLIGLVNFVVDRMAPLDGTRCRVWLFLHRTPLERTEMVIVSAAYSEGP